MRRWAALIVIMLLALVLAGTLTACAPTAATAPEPTGVPVSLDTPAALDIDALAASVVRLEIYDANDSKIATGSGFAAFEPAVLVTARHVLINMKYIIATRDDGSSFRIDRIIEQDEPTDVALCELPGDAGLKALPLSGSLPKRGERVTAIGSQFGLVNLVTDGTVCGIWNTTKGDRIVFTAPVSGGSSGGPVFDSDGNVTGIVTGTYEKGQNLNIAAPAGAAYALNGSDTDQGGK